MAEDLDANKELVRRLALNKGDRGELEQLLSDDFVNHSPLPGLPSDREGYLRSRELLTTTLPDLTVSVEDIIAEGDRVAVRVVERGTHRAPLMGVPATGRAVTMAAMAVFRVSNHKITERWALADMMSVTRQIRDGS